MRARKIYLVAVVAFVLAPCVTAQEQWPTSGWPVSTPAVVGIELAPLKSFDTDIAAGKYGYVDSMLVIRCGRAVYERFYRHDYDRIYGGRTWLDQDPKGPYNYFNPDWHPYYRRGDLHTMQSVTKTVTSAVFGVAMARKELPDLDTPILRFFDVKTVANLDDRKRRITLRHLLTMTAGFDWNEDLPYGDRNNSCDQMEATKDWVKFVIDRPMAHEPGAAFAYSSGVSQLLSYIFTKVTGQDIEKYAAKHLFRPLGIDHYYWKRSPTGLTDTEGGLYLRPQDLAKFGYLYLKNGVWDGRQILAPDWVKESLSPSVTVARGGTKYGYQWWLIPHGNRPELLAWAAQGLGGQRLIIVPEYDLILTFTGWNLEKNPPLNSREVLERLVPAISEKGCGEMPLRKVSD